MLIAAGADAKKPDNEGNTPCHVACHEGHDNIVCILIAAGADIDMVDNGGRKVCCIASYNGYDTIRYYLCS